MEKGLFEKYLGIIKEKYEESDIKKFNWYYSLSSTPLYKNSVVISGFNWGVKDPNSPQTECPTIDFMNNNDLGSLIRIKEYLRKYLTREDENKIVQINLCFFRSKKQSDISLRDYNTSKDIFISLVKELQPKILIALNSKIHDVLKPYLVFESIKTIKSYSKKIRLIKASFNKEFGGGVFAYVPHPDYPLTHEARLIAWEYAFSDNRLM